MLALRIRTTQPQNKDAGRHQKLQEARQGFSPGASGGSAALRIPRFGPSGRFQTSGP